jgi:hypothetical protein
MMHVMCNPWKRNFPLVPLAPFTVFSPIKGLLNNLVLVFDSQVVSLVLKVYMFHYYNSRFFKLGFLVKKYPKVIGVKKTTLSI